jgi:precorrin-2 dehydrogenase / sirohydrochlorin ferrochelatase
LTNLFPMFLKLDGRTCLVVGAGKVGEPKIASLLVSGARVRVVAPEASEQVVGWHRTQAISWEARVFQPSDLDGVFLVIAATGSTEVNKLVFREAQRRQILCNSVDDPPRCDFFYPAVVRRGQLQIAISTAGLSPALAQRLRCELESQFGPEYAEWLQELGQDRARLFAIELAPEDRRRQLHLSASREAFTTRFHGHEPNQGSTK